MLIDEKEKTVIGDIDIKLQKELKYLQNREKDTYN